MATAVAAPTTAPVRKLRIRRWLFAGVSILILVWLGPMLVAHSPILAWIIRLAARDVQGTVSVGSASLGWFSPPVLRDLRVCDSAGATVVAIDRLATDRTLLGLFCDHTDLGTIHIEQPVVHIALAGGTTNVQHLLRSSAAPPERKAATAAPKARVVVRNGQIRFRDADRNLTYGIEAFDLDLEATAPPKLKLAARGQLNDGAGALEFSAALDGAQLTVEKALVTSRACHLSARGIVDLARDRLDLDTLRFNSEWVSGEGHLTCTELSAARRVEFTGQLAYDLEKVEPLLRPYLGSQVTITGKGARPLRLHGPLTPTDGKPVLAALEAEAGGHWSAIRAFPGGAGQGHGCMVGPAEVRAKLHSGIVVVAPVQAACNGGTIHVAPKLRLEPGPIMLDVPAGPLLERVQLTPGLCASGLRYALPLLADVAEVDGKLSLRLDHARLPLADAKAADVKGTLVLHDAKVAPGPAIRAINEVLRVGSAYGIVRPSDVRFTMAHGKVRHDNLELVFPDFSLRTSGTVDLDGTLQLIGELTIHAKSHAKNPLLASLAKQSWKVPIRGTIDRPQVDVRALGSAAAGSALEGLVVPRLEQGLKKLVPPRP
ncbi:MAG: hypothetical protein NZO58_01360 [Gemmataceae bacterium]|nr:hypothetical protein [Gemmataceae bacterium]